MIILVAIIMPIAIGWPLILMAFGVAAVAISPIVWIMKKLGMGEYS